MKVEICLGTTCYLLGAADLLEELKELNQTQSFELKGTNCLQACKLRDQYGAPPYIKIDGQILGNAHIDMVRSNG
ncbi:(2Fe-2S) ferredoxin domain-containing protein [Spirochaeta cellobiosiphila]|uniref:(2Fe-2S) ferredoxin domain-containing protein n=1 Tax=Spirochaeta cellobiosiphila TaxID=504483 RepID=UPI000405A2CE|nr:(2Fe-2S) ferredoxin domain-containing protein [Spirochaeta cellobiosiphila]